MSFINKYDSSKIERKENVPPNIVFHQTAFHFSSVQPNKPVQQNLHVEFDTNKVAKAQDLSRQGRSKYYGAGLMMAAVVTGAAFPATWPFSCVALLTGAALCVWPTRKHIAFKKEMEDVTYFGKEEVLPKKAILPSKPKKSLLKVKDKAEPVLLSANQLKLQKLYDEQINIESDKIETEKEIEARNLKLPLSQEDPLAKKCIRLQQDLDIIKNEMAIVEEAINKEGSPILRDLIVEKNSIKAELQVLHQSIREIHAKLHAEKISKNDEEALKKQQIENARDKLFLTESLKIVGKKIERATGTTYNLKP